MAALRLLAIVLRIGLATGLHDLLCDVTNRCCCIDAVAQGIANLVGWHSVVGASGTLRGIA